MSLNRNFTIKCKVYWEKSLGNEPKNVAKYINNCIAEVEKDYDVYDFGVSEYNGYYTVYVKYKKYVD